MKALLGILIGLGAGLAAIGASATNAGNAVSVFADGSYTLQWNLVENQNGQLADSGGRWDNVNPWKNCYDWAFESVLDIYAPDTNRNIPRCLSNSSLPSDFTAEDVAEVVQGDLMACGYDVSISMERPLSIANGQTLVCTRVGRGDFHFMRWSNQVGGMWGWTQKFIESAPLLYLRDCKGHTGNVGNRHLKM